MSFFIMHLVLRQVLPCSWGWPRTLSSSQLSLPSARATPVHHLTPSKIFIINFSCLYSIINKIAFIDNILPKLETGAYHLLMQSLTVGFHNVLLSDGELHMTDAHPHSVCVWATSFMLLSQPFLSAALLYSFLSVVSPPLSSFVLISFLPHVFPLHRLRK